MRDLGNRADSQPKPDFRSKSATDLTLFDGHASLLLANAPLNPDQMTELRLSHGSHLKSNT